MTDSAATAQLRARVDAAKAVRLGHLLGRASRLFHEHALVAVQQAGFPEVRESWIGLLRYLEADGLRSSVLAERMGVSRQAAGQLVSELTRLGYLERRPDPSDGRAKLICMTERGWSAWLAGLNALADLEQALEAVLERPDEGGRTRLDRLRADGAALLAGLENLAANT